MAHIDLSKVVSDRLLQSSGAQEQHIEESEDINIPESERIDENDLKFPISVISAGIATHRYIKERSK